MTLTSEHRKFLESRAIDPDLAMLAGVVSVTTAADLDPAIRWAAAHGLPGLAFPWTSPAGVVVWQYRPDDPDEVERKYLSEVGKSVIWQLPDGGVAVERVVFVEGTKQALACLSALRSVGDVATLVVAVAGCSNWTTDGVPTDDLAVADGLPSFIVFDADLSTNRDVWTAADGFRYALRIAGSTDVRFGLTPGRGSSGLDDYLAGQDPARRGDLVRRILDAAGDKLPAKPKPGKPKPAAAPAGRPWLYVDDDPGLVTVEAVNRLAKKFKGEELFTFGGVITLVEGATTDPLDFAGLHEQIMRTSALVRDAGQRGTVPALMPEPLLRVIARQTEPFPVLDRISRAPFVRADGSLCTRPGYDEASRTLLVLDPGLVGLEVPERPTPADVDAALEVLAGPKGWLGDFVRYTFVDKSDLANALGLALTALVRGLCPLAPLAVLDGSGMGVGKNLLAETTMAITHGAPLAPLNLPTDQDEASKVILSVFRAGTDWVVFDEAHVVRGTALANALTAPAIHGRILGKSQVASFPNSVTWAALGNNVTVSDDLIRRVYFIRLRSDDESPDTRRDFVHRELLVWVMEHRAELLRALLVLVRNWFALGKPDPTTSVGFGSFERWQAVVGGILEAAGVVGFLDGRKEWASDSDYSRGLWGAHLEDLFEHYGSSRFTAGEVARECRLKTIEHLPEGFTVDNVEAQELGRYYSRKRDNRLNGLVLRRYRPAGETNRSVRWWVETDAPAGGSSSGMSASDPETPDTWVRGSRGSGGSSGKRVLVNDRADPDQGMHARAYRAGAGNTPRSPRSPHPDPGRKGTDASNSANDVTVVDLETHDAADRWDRVGFVRLAGRALDDGPVVLDLPVRDLYSSGVLVTHNGNVFDLPAMVEAGALDLLEAAARDRLWDTKIAAVVDFPPAAGLTVDQVRKAYSLDGIAAMYGTPCKVDDVKRLARKFGGFGRIPITDPEFRAYLVGDVEATRAVYRAQAARATGYGVREQRVLGKVVAGVTARGFRVDVEELERRYAAGQAVLAARRAWLTSEHGMPTAVAEAGPGSSPEDSSAGRAALESAFAALGAHPERWPKSWRTDKGALSFSAGTMRLVADHARARGMADLVELCEVVADLRGVRSVYGSIRDHTHRGRIHPTVEPWQASGRLSVREPGLTTIGKRGGKHVERGVFLPDPGEVLLCADLDQVDARVVAGFAGDPNYSALFLDPDVDAHEEVAYRLWGVRDGKSGEYRNRAKQIAHGWNYGESTRRIARDSGIPLAEVEKFDRAMREDFAGLVSWQDDVRRAARERDPYLENGFGRRMRPDPNRAHTQGPALMGQGGARDVFLEGIDRLPLEVVSRLRAVVHDELVLTVPADAVEDVKAAVRKAYAFDFRGIPIRVGFSRPGSTWAACYDK